MLYLFNDDVFTVDGYKDIARAKLNSISPPRSRRIKRMRRCCYYFFSANLNMSEMIGFNFKCLRYKLLLLNVFMTTGCFAAENPISDDHIGASYPENIITESKRRKKYT